jgi:serine/threonine protein kinase
MDSAAEDLIRQLLVKEPAMRIGAENLEDLKNHEYFKGVEWESLRKNPVPYNQNRRPVRGFKAARAGLERL